MKTKVILLALTLGASTCLLPAQTTNQNQGGQRPTRREGGPGGPGGLGGAGNERGGPGGPGGAGNERGGPGGPGGMGGQRPVNPIIEALDLNHDGIIDADEIAKASESLKKLDKNGDGKLTPDEYRPQRPAGMGGMGGMGGPGGQGGPGMGGQGRGPGGQGGPGMRGGGPGPGGQRGAGGENRPQRPELEK